MDIEKQVGPKRIDTMICAECRQERREMYDCEIGQFRFTLCKDCLIQLEQLIPSWAWTE